MQLSSYAKKPPYTLPFNDPAWEYEVKWDGYRMLAYQEAGAASLRSRNDNDYTSRFKIVAEELERYGQDWVVDGEMVVLKEDGTSHFNSLENWNSPTDGELRYYVFDVLYLGGKSLLTEPLEKHRRIREKLMPKSDLIRFVDHFPGTKREELFELGLFFLPALQGYTSRLDCISFDAYSLYKNIRKPINRPTI